MKNVLVIGGSGFVGKAVVRSLQKNGAHVAVLNRGSLYVTGTEQLIANRDDASAVRAALGHRKFDVAIDTNCYRAHQASILIDAVERLTPQVLMISSAAIYADDARQPPQETDKTGGASVWGDYGREKSEAEMVFIARSRQFDSVTIIRPPYIFGPGNNLERERWFWSRQLNAIPIVLPGTGDTRVQFIHEDDLGDAIVFLATRAASGCGVFNVADRQILTLGAFSRMLAEVAGAADIQIKVGNKFPEISARTWFPFRDYPCLADPSQLYAAGWKPSALLRDRFAETFLMVSTRGNLRKPALTPFEQKIAVR
jgi:nucleoside-diphosphate-sugar epimerase